MEGSAGVFGHDWAWLARTQGGAIVLRTSHPRGRSQARPGVSENIRQRPTLPGPCGPSTIGAEGLNCSVRNGKRCFPLAMATGNLARPGRSTTLENRSQSLGSTSEKRKSVKPSTH
jgi:hypothetical protein